MIKKYLLILLLPINVYGQILPNGSFEGPPGMSVSPTGWDACGQYSTPDTQPTQADWNFPKSASAGNTYMSLVMRGSVGSVNDYLTEAAGTKLLQPIHANSCYTVTIDLATYIGASFNNGWETVYYNNPGRLAIWGSNVSCGKSKLLWESPVVQSENWTTFTFEISQAESFTYLLLEARHADPNIKVFGNIMIDNMKITSEVFGFDSDLLICEGSPVNLLAPTGIDHISWWNNETNNSVTVSAAGNYWAKLTKGSCTILDTIRVNSIHKIYFDLGRDTTLCTGDYLSFDVSEQNAQYEWNDGLNLPNRTIAQSGEYWVTVKNQCEEVRDDIKITYREECCEVSMPNVFTPNGDAYNNFFEFSTESALVDFNLTVFNRWGDEIFKSDDLNNFWDGHDGKHEVSTGTYFWVCQIKCKHKQEILEKSLRGHVLVVK